MYLSVDVNCVYVSVYACTLCVCFHVCPFWGFIAPFCIPPFTHGTNTNRGLTAGECPSGSHGVFWPAFIFLCCYWKFASHLSDTLKTDPSSGESISGVWLLCNAPTVPSLILFLFKFLVFLFPVFFPLPLSSSSFGGPGPGQPSLPVLLGLLVCNSEWRLLCPLWRTPDNNKIADNAKDSF